MNEFLADLYGTGKTIEKQAAAQPAADTATPGEQVLLTKIASDLAEESIDVNNLTEEEADRVLDAYLSNLSEEDIQALEAIDAEGGEGGGEGMEAEAQAKLAEADFMGRTMAHAFVNEMGEINKAAEAQPKGVGITAFLEKVARPTATVPHPYVGPDPSFPRRAPAAPFWKDANPLAGEWAEQQKKVMGEHAARARVVEEARVKAGSGASRATQPTAAEFEAAQRARAAAAPRAKSTGVAAAMEEGTARDWARMQQEAARRATSTAAPAAEIAPKAESRILSLLQRAWAHPAGKIGVGAAGGLAAAGGGLALYKALHKRKAAK